MKCKSILIVEDDEAIRESLQMALELEGHHVFTAANGQEGFAVLANVPAPCLILLDLMMPQMNGWEFVEELRHNTVLEKNPVIIVTAFPFRAKTLNATLVVKKPIDLDHLFGVIGHYCG